jgi:hypothetical protein
MLGLVRLAKDTGYAGTRTRLSEGECHDWTGNLRQERYDTKLWMRDLMEGVAYLPK